MKKETIILRVKGIATTTLGRDTDYCGMCLDFDVSHISTSWLFLSTFVSFRSGDEGLTYGGKSGGSRSRRRNEELEFLQSQVSALLLNIAL